LEDFGFSRGVADVKENLIAKRNFFDKKVVPITVIDTSVVCLIAGLIFSFSILQRSILLMVGSLLSIVCLKWFLIHNYSKRKLKAGSFDLTLPLVNENKFEATPRALHKRLKEEKSDETNTSAISILMAEDNPTNMLLIKSYFKNLIPNVKLIEATDGQMAFDSFKKFKPILVITDLQMPKLNGYELTRSIRHLAYGKNVPIIALTAGIINGEREKCLAAGMDDYISKPVLQDTLSLVVEKWLTGNGMGQGFVDSPQQTAEVIQQVNVRLAKVLDIKGKDADEIIGVAKVLLVESLKGLEQAYNTHDVDTLKHITHKIRATALTLGFSTLHKVAYKIESKNLFFPQDQPVVEQLRHEINHVVNHL